MNRSAFLRGLAVDVGIPLVTYYVLHAMGVGDWMALLASSLVAAARVVVEAVRHRRVNAFALVMLITLGLGLILSFVTGEPRFLLLKQSFVTGAIGCAFLFSTIGDRRPLTRLAMESWSSAAEAPRYPEEGLQRVHRRISRVWGVGMLAEAAIRAPLVYLLPISVMVGLSAALMTATFTGLGIWTIATTRRYRVRPPDPSATSR